MLGIEVLVYLHHQTFNSTKKRRMYEISNSINILNRSLHVCNSCLIVKLNLLVKIGDTS